MAEKKETTALAIPRRNVETLSLSEIKEVCQIFIESELCKDTKSVSQAIVKVMAGQEIGLKPFESMSGLNIISGKVTISANVMSTKIAESGKYIYRVIELTNKICSIDFFEVVDGKREKLGNSTFTIEDAEKINYWDYKANKSKKLTEKDNWVNYTRNMLFARALSNGERWYTPDVFGGTPVYTPDEMGLEEDEDGNIKNITPTDSPVAPKKPKALKDAVKVITTTEPPYPYQDTSFNGDTATTTIEPTPELKVIPNNPLPSTKKPRGRPKAEKSQHYNIQGVERTPTNIDGIGADCPTEQDNPHESESEAEPEQVKEATEKPPKTEDGLQLAPSVIEKMKNAGTPREAFEIMERYALQGQGHHLKALVKQFCPEFFERGFSIDQIPESALIVMIKTASGLKLKAVEKTLKCKTKGCKNQLTEADENPKCWECRAKEPEG